MQLNDDTPDARMAKYRALLASDAWPEPADALLPFPYGKMGLGEDTELPEAELLDMVADAQRYGIDIQLRFPHLYQRVQSNPALRDAFLETMEMM